MNLTWYDIFLATPGRMAPLEGAFLHALTLAASRYTSSGKALELGTYRGRSACAIGAACKLVGMKLVAIDNFSQTLAELGESARSIAETSLADAGLSDVVSVIEGDSHKYRHLGALSMLFIDAAHDDVSVRADFDTWWPDVQHGGLIAFHDSGAKGVASVIKEKREQHNLIYQGQVGSVMAFQKP